MDRLTDIFHGAVKAISFLILLAGVYNWATSPVTTIIQQILLVSSAVACAVVPYVFCKLVGAVK